MVSNSNGNSFLDPLDLIQYVLNFSSISFYRRFSLSYYETLYSLLILSAYSTGIILGLSKNHFF